MNSANLLCRKRPIASAVVVCLVMGILLSTLAVREVSAEKTHKVKITDFSFVPRNLTIIPGDIVVWNNTDPVIHTLWFIFVTNESTYLLSDPILPGETWTHTFNEVVELQYYSFEHLWITGFLSVAYVHDVAVIETKPWKTVVGQGHNCKINVTVANEGSFTETFDLTLRAFIVLPPALIETRTVSNLPKGETTIITFIWNTTGWVKGNYTVSAYAWPVSEETETDDNNFIDGKVLVTVPGDVNGDRICDMKDITALILAFGSREGDPKYKPNYDINCDGKIDMKDIVIAILHFGQRW